MRTVRRMAPAALAPLIAGGLGAPDVAAAADAAEGWEWTLAPYLWAPKTSLDVTVNDEPVIGGDLDFSDLLDKLDFSGQVHFEGRRGKTGFFLDLTYLSTSDSGTTSPRPPLPGGTAIDSEVDTALFEAAGFYRPLGESHGLDLLLGVRIIDYQQTLDIALPSPSTVSTEVDVSKTYTDGFAGLRYVAPITGHWSLVVRGDVGAGDTEFTWNALALAAYGFGATGRNTLLFGYRHLEIELEGSDSAADVETELTMSGPIAGFAFRF